MVLYFRNVDLDLPKISELFWTPVLSRYGDENLTSWKNHLVHLWPTSFIRANYVQLPQQNFSRTPLFNRKSFVWLLHESVGFCWVWGLKVNCRGKENFVTEKSMYVQVRDLKEVCVLEDNESSLYVHSWLKFEHIQIYRTLCGKRGN